MPFLSSLPSTFPFLLVILIELPPSILFLVKPDGQFPVIEPQARAVIRQYALLLQTVNLIALICCIRPVDETSRLIAGAMSVYQVGPSIRAAFRMARGEKWLGGSLGGPLVHFVVHVTCLASLLKLCAGANLVKRLVLA